MKKCLTLYSQVHTSFRNAELEGICSLFGIPCDAPQLDTQNHVFVLELPTVDCMLKILSRSVLIKFAIECSTVATDYDELSSEITAAKDYFSNYDVENQSFAIRIYSFGMKNDQQTQMAKIEKIVEALSFTQSKVNLSNPTNSFYAIEEFDSNSSKRIRFGKLIGFGQSQLKNDYNLPERRYIGNTTMDPELSFIQANIVKAGFGSVILDPFCGTGGLLLAAAHFDAVVIGTEINYKIARALGKSSRADVECLSANESVTANFADHSIDKYFLGLIIADASQRELWLSFGVYQRPVFDAIITDPPYGIRERGQKVCMKPNKDSWVISNLQHENHFPSKAKYKMSAAFLDLLNFSSKVLVLHGRLSFWFPVIDDEYSEAVLPRHNAMQLISNCRQPLSKRYSRRLLTYKKVREPVQDESAFIADDCYRVETFRQRVFEG